MLLSNWRTWGAAIGLIVLGILLILAQRENAALKAQIHAMTEAAQRAEIEAQDTQRAIEREWQAKADAAARSAAAELSTIEANYENSIQSLYALLADRDAGVSLSAAGAGADGVHADRAGGDSAALPAAAGPASRACAPCASGRGAADTGRLQRLLERQMIVARDCDITASRYNELLRLWEAVN